MRLDKFVSSQRNDISRSMVRELCRKGQVTVNGKVAKAADAKVSENDIVAVNQMLPLHSRSARLHSLKHPPRTMARPHRL